MMLGLISGLSLANHSDSESFLEVHALFNQDECQQEGFLHFAIEYRVDYGFIINSCYYVEAGSLFIHFDKSE